MATLEDHLAANHGIVVRHKNALLPEKLIYSLTSVFGSVNSFSTFTMSTSADLLSVIFFTDSKVNADCLSDLRAISHGIASCVVSVGWIHEDHFTKFWTSKSYIKGRYASTVKEEEPNVQPKGYLIIFWKYVPIESQRDEIEMFVNGFTCSRGMDVKEGGRLFLAFETDQLAIDFLHAFKDRFPYLTRCVSLADEEDIQLASPSFTSDAT